MKSNIGADKKNSNHFLAPLEQKVCNFCFPLVPAWLSTAHLTLMTLLWAFGVVILGVLANQDIRWLWGTNVLILLQYLTDMLDGDVGRRRGTGLIKWGFYMDHFCDYVFLCAIILGYSFLLPSSDFLLVSLCLVICAGFLIHVLLDFGITDDFKISFNRFGISESRFVVIIGNIILIYCGKDLLDKVLPALVVIFFFMLCIVVYHAQKIYGQMDIKGLKKNE